MLTLSVLQMGFRAYMKPVSVTRCLDYLDYYQQGSSFDSLLLPRQMMTWPCLAIVGFYVYMNFCNVFESLSIDCSKFIVELQQVLEMEYISPPREHNSYPYPTIIEFPWDWIRIDIPRFTKFSFLVTISFYMQIFQSTQTTVNHTTPMYYNILPNSTPRVKNFLNNTEGKDVK